MALPATLRNCTEHDLRFADQDGFGHVNNGTFGSLIETNQTATRYWKPTGLWPNIVFKTSSVEAVRSMVADGIGITILSDMVYRPWSLEGQRIELRNVVADIPTMDIGLAWNRLRPRTPATKSFHDFLSLSFGGASGPA